MLEYKPRRNNIIFPKTTRIVLYNLIKAYAIIIELSIGAIIRQLPTQTYEYLGQLINNLQVNQMILEAENACQHLFQLNEHICMAIVGQITSLAAVGDYSSLKDPGQLFFCCCALNCLHFYISDDLKTHNLSSTLSAFQNSSWFKKITQLPSPAQIRLNYFIREFSASFHNRSSQKNVADYLYCYSPMLTSRVVSLSLLLLTLAFLADSHTIQQQPLVPNSSPDAAMPHTGRQLQATSVNNPQISAAISKIIVDSNAARKEKGRPALSVNSSLTQIIRQWAVSLKGRMSLSQYMQLYGIHSSQSYTFSSVPSDYLADVVKKGSPALTNPDFTTIGTFSRASDGQNYEVIVVLQGGYDAIQEDLSKDDILKIIKEIESLKPKIDKNQPNVPVQKNPTPNVPQASTLKEDPKTVEVFPAPKHTEAPVKPSLKDAQPPIIVQSKTQQAKNIAQQPKTPPKQQPKSEQKPTLESEHVNTPPSLINNLAPSDPKQPQLQQLGNLKPNVTQQMVKKAQQGQAPGPRQEQINTPNNYTNITQQPADMPKPQTIVPIIIVPSPIQIITPPRPITYTPPPPARETPSFQPTSRPNRTSAPASNNPSFKNIVLSHNVPSTFVKNEAFPFRGSITVPNPSGVRVNVIFARITDQRRMSFNTYLPPNTTEFEVLATLTMSGNYYISIFTGTQGSTSLIQYTVIPDFFGRITGKSPDPLNDAALELRGNDLWLTWRSSPPTPALTQIIFSQQNGASLQFLLSNYKTSLQIPYAQFTSFSPGLTTVSIAQADCLGQSASQRNSNFSAPYTIIFNATTHNFAKFTGPKFFENIPYRIEVNGSINIKGKAPPGGLQNEVILLSPRKGFLSYNLTTNNKSKYVNSGVDIDVKIQLKEAGNYILEVNNAAGQAVINMPIYVGDIYPLLPDFIDLAPASPDSAALNEPSGLESRRSIIIQFINAIRSQFGAPSLYLDSNLNSLAQNYSSRLIQLKFFSHTDPYGSTPGSRAKATGIFQKVGQNLAINSNLTQAQLMLQRSPAHLRSMVDPSWTRVGLGIVQNSNQVYYLTQEFSSRDMALYPLTNSELADIQKSIINYIQSQFPHLKTENKQLSSDLSSFQKSKSNKNVVEYLNGLGYNKFDIDEVEISYNAGNYIELLEGNDYFQPNEQYRRVGVSVMYKDGNLLIQTAYN